MERLVRGIEATATPDGKGQGNAAMVDEQQCP